ncbi:putative L-cysteine desulfhydrase 1 isoform X4 [Lytechinus variegatus]|nr:putative L-cysteine desulfhydrase 1 isoform X4 [Lytechinus variegatus]XP_041481947.1 putative L-cysteine desulfhydrase 1 isoform X4 [Lytechinus variegatus]XP_041481948.1 putative L-cysteine desulfhydrase 1 isoform X4 [Lytechinus variegatus]XP_041481949.1 putative L-cysteine desulfhydrase 1 isoform X4 [Lytechinus variegatus]
MPERNLTMRQAVIMASGSICIYEILRRVASWVWWTTPDKQEKVPEKVDDPVHGSGPLPEFGESLRAREYSFPDGTHTVNNGAYGCVPQIVLREQKRLMDERETNPEMWYRYLSPAMYKDAVKNVAEFVGAKPENLVLVENVTTATNAIVKSFRFRAGDQILVTNHTFKAVLTTLDYWVTTLNQLDQDISIVPIKIPVQTTAKEIIEHYSRALDENPRINLAMIDHITSSSAIVMPIKELVDLCHSRGVMVAIDGAHAPGQIPLRLEDLGADFYYGNLHKWLFSPRGCALLYVHPKHQRWIQTPVSSYNTLEENLQERFQDNGTRDSIPYYTVKHCINFLNYLGGLERVTAYNSELVQWAAEMLSKAWGTTWIELEENLRAPFMRLIVLPQTKKLLTFKTNRELAYEVLNQHGIVTAITGDGKNTYLRISAQVYNYKEEYHALRDAIIDILDI